MFVNSFETNCKERTCRRVMKNESGKTNYTYCNYVLSDRMPRWYSLKLTFPVLLLFSIATISNGNIIPPIFGTHFYQSTCRSSEGK